MSTVEFTFHTEVAGFFKYLESQNKGVLSQKLSTKPHTNFMLFF